VDGGVGDWPRTTHAEWLQPGACTADDERAVAGRGAIEVRRCWTVYSFSLDRYAVRLWIPAAGRELLAERGPDGVVPVTSRNAAWVSALST
jgi:hypothetical protein